MTLVGTQQASAAKALSDAGIETAALDARVLLAHVTGLPSEEIWAARDRRLSADEQCRFEALLVRRLAREPVAYLTGRREFWSLEIGVDRNVLIPRPDSEALIEAVLAALPERRAPRRVLDLGTGSGCLLMALLAEWPNAVGVGVDRSEHALGRARATAGVLGLGARASWLCADWASALTSQFDVVVSNPPYIPDDHIATLAPDVARYEPLAALSGGADGLDAYRRLFAGLAARLAPRAIVAVEFGEGQGCHVAALAQAAGLATRNFVEDLSGRPRALLASGTS